jgi:hypothetical protein
MKEANTSKTPFSFCICLAKPQRRRRVCYISVRLRCQRRGKRGKTRRNETKRGGDENDLLFVVSSSFRTSNAKQSVYLWFASLCRLFSRAAKGH